MKNVEEVSRQDTKEECIENGNDPFQKAIPENGS